MQLRQMRGSRELENIVCVCGSGLVDCLLLGKSVQRDKSEWSVFVGDLINEEYWRNTAC